MSKNKVLKSIAGVLIAICIAFCFSGCGQDEVEPTEAEIDLDSIVASIDLKDGFKPKLGIVLGSGLGVLADKIDVVQKIDYNDIDMFPHSTVKGHDGEYVLGYIGDVPVILMNGRIHYYEGYSMEEVVTPVRIMAMLGAETVILTNAAGSLRKDFRPGDLVCINDHISSLVPNPLRGQNDEELGERFPGMINAYDKKLRKLAHKAADETGIKLKEGVYIQVAGPSFETRAECKFFASVGADMLGMSTACETIALRHMGIKVLGISCISNYCPNVSSEKVSSDDVENTANKSGANMVKLIKRIVKKIGK